MKRTTLMLACAALLLSGSSPLRAGLITPGFDLLSTPTQTATIAGLGDVTEHGVPIGPGNTDTIVQRFNGLADGQSGVINAQIVALSVAGTILDGPFAGLNFSVALDPSHASLGQLDVMNPTGPGGGTFTSFFDVFTDITLSTPGGQVVAVVPHEDLIQSSTTPWQETPAPGYPNDTRYPAGGFYITPAGITHTGPHPHVDPAGPATPEPATLAPACLAGLAGAAYAWRKRRRASAAG
jgi:hypothetical protein